MGIFDTIKDKAGDLAGDAERAGKVGAAQVKLKSLQGDVDDAMKVLGREAFGACRQGRAGAPRSRTRRRQGPRRPAARRRQEGRDRDDQGRRRLSATRDGNFTGRAAPVSRRHLVGSLATKEAG